MAFDNLYHYINFWLLSGEISKTVKWLTTVQYQVGLSLSSNIDSCTMKTRFGFFLMI